MEVFDIVYQREAPLARAIFNRPKRLNAFRQQGCRELIALLEDFTEDPSLKVLLLTGAGRAFSTGIDLHSFDVFAEGELQEFIARERLAELQRISELIFACPKPIIAAVNGTAVGLGLEIALACDIRIATEHAQFSFAEVRRGLFQTNGVMYLLPRLIGYGRAQELLLTGRKVKADEALDIGLLSQVHTTEDFPQAVDDLLDRLLTNAPRSLRLIKKLGQQAMELSIAEVMDLEVEGMMDCLRSHDLQEGLLAFSEKRKPIYQDH